METSCYPHLFGKIQIGNIILPNRIVMSPMNEGNTPENSFLEKSSIDYYGERAKGGTGMIIIDCFTVVDEKTDPYSPEKRLYRGPKHYTLAEIAREIRLNGAVPAIQLSPGLGSQGKGALDPNNLPGDVSPLPCRQDPSVLCREMTATELRERAEAFGEAAVLAYEAGFRMVNINAHGGYLFPRFLSPVVNRRTDAYGGSTENRFRFLQETARAIKNRLGNRMGLILRLSLDRLGYLGTTLEESLRYCQLAEAAGYDALDVDAGSTDQDVMYFYPTMYLGETPLADYTRAVKRVVKIPVAAVGMYRTPELAEQMLAAGEADLIYLGRPLLADPRWAQKAKRGEAQAIRPCIQCLERCVENVNAGRTLSCAVNPQCGYEYRSRLERAETSRWVVVVGAGPGGIAAALTAQRRGHRVLLLERTGEIGGQIRFAARECFKGGLRQYRRYLDQQLAHSGVELRLNCRADPAMLEALRPEVLVLAVGGRPRKSDLPGADGPDIYYFDTFSPEKWAAGSRVLILGGGAVGSEAALDLKRRGVDVILLSRSGELGRGCSSVNRYSLEKALEESGTKILRRWNCLEFQDHAAVCAAPDGRTKSLSYDAVLVAIGTVAEESWADQAERLCGECYRLGDCVEPGKIADAVEQGYYIGNRI